MYHCYTVVVLSLRGRVEVLQLKGFGDPAGSDPDTISARERPLQHAEDLGVVSKKWLQGRRICERFQRYSQDVLVGRAAVLQSRNFPSDGEVALVERQRETLLTLTSTAPLGGPSHPSPVTCSLPTSLPNFLFGRFRLPIADAEHTPGPGRWIL